MPRKKSTAEARRISEGKDGLDNYKTARELSVLINVNESTVKRWARAGKIPKPTLVSTSGWALWDPKAVQRIIQLRTNRGRNG